MKIPAKKPVVGITLDCEEAGGYAALPWYALRRNYAEAVAHHGGVALMIPYQQNAVEHYLGMIDALMVPGGDFDIDPAMFGAKTVHEKVTMKPSRTTFEAGMMRGAIERKMPVLGICAGEQLMNVLLGGTLIQHIPDEVPDCLEHEQKNPRTETSHAIAITKNTLLHKIVGRGEMQVNSSHHQAVAKVGPDVVVNAVAPDGVIEGIEYTKHPFCLGVEWHPEYEITEGDKAIMAALVKAA